MTAMSEVATMTLSEFLLARITEDEERANDTHLFDCVIDHIDGRDGCSCTIPARVLAECEAKRRIVEHHSAKPSPPTPGFECAWCGMNWPCFDLRNAASVYVDHPDYREEWKP